jgi:hypothetical protein
LSFGSGVYFAVYNYLKSTMAPEGRGGHFVLGAATGIVYWLSVFGLDTIKTRLMVDLAQEKPVSDSIFDEKQDVCSYLTHLRPLRQFGTVFKSCAQSAGEAFGASCSGRDCLLRSFARDPSTP